MRTFCTIIDTKFLPYAKVLFNSLNKNSNMANLQVLVTDSKDTEQSNEIGFQIWNTTSVLKSNIANHIYKRYAATNHDAFRWAMKPVFLLHLLNSGFEKVIYIDADVYFTGNTDFLFDSLNENFLLLSPHWSNVNPLLHEDGLYSVLRNGLYSGCFVGANIKGQQALQWWAEACHYKMEKVRELGLYDDQKYLDLFPILNKETGIIRHKGCNIASINIDTSKREIIDGKLMIDKIYEPVFIHFTKDTIINILNKNDKLLQPYLEEYIRSLKEEKFDLLKNLDNLDPSKYHSIGYSIKHKLSLRTRIKRFLFRLAEKL